jgi:hypothetical protein
MCVFYLIHHKNLYIKLVQLPGFARVSPPSLQTSTLHPTTPASTPSSQWQKKIWKKSKNFPKIIGLSPRCADSRNFLISFLISAMAPVGCGYKYAKKILCDTLNNLYIYIYIYRFCYLWFKLSKRSSPATRRPPERHVAPSVVHPAELWLHRVRPDPPLHHPVSVLDEPSLRVLPGRQLRVGPEALAEGGKAGPDARLNGVLVNLKIKRNLNQQAEELCKKTALSS